MMNRQRAEEFLRLRRQGWTTVAAARRVGITVYAAKHVLTQVEYLARVGASRWN